MKADYKVLGDYIRLVDQRNRDLSVTNLLGVSIEKRFIPSIANIVGTDLSSYKIVRTGQFAYGPVTSRNGEKISMSYRYPTLIWMVTIASYQVLTQYLK